LLDKPTFLFAEALICYTGNCLIKIFHRRNFVYFSSAYPFTVTRNTKLHHFYIKILQFYISYYKNYKFLLSGVQGESVHFYGNSGVCVFKYLVTQNDPQRWFTMCLLIVNFACFIIISFSYIAIHSKTSVSSRNLAGSENRTLANRNRKLQLKVSVIILTDFLCWIPFTIVCFLHFGEVIDATMWYAVFSSIILPINSVINPLLYDNLLGATLIRPLKASYSKASTFITSFRRRYSQNNVEEPAASCSNTENLEMKEKNR
jgi:hypothetical protein